MCFYLIAIIHSASKNYKQHYNEQNLIIYFAKLTALVSLMTFTFISAGYCTFASISFAISLLSITASLSPTFFAFTMTLISLPAFMAYACSTFSFDKAIFSSSFTLLVKLSRTSRLAPGLAALRTSAVHTAALSMLLGSSCPW